MKRPTIAYEKRDDRGGVYYWRAYIPRKAPEKGYNRVYRSTEVKSLERAKEIAEAELTKLLSGDATLAPRLVSEIVATGQAISTQVDTFIKRTMQFSSTSYIRATTRQLGFLVKYIRSHEGKGEARNLVEDITPGSIDEVIETLKRLRSESGKEPFSFKYWAEIYNDWDRWAGWQLKQPGNKMPQNWFTKDHLPRPDKSKFGKRKELWDDEVELKPFLADTKENDPELWQLSMVIRWTGIDPADYFDLKTAHLKLKSDGHWYVVKERAKEPGKFYNVPIPEITLPIFLTAMETCAGDPDMRMFTSKYANHQRESWGTMVSWRRARVYKRLFPGKKVKTLKDMRRTFSDYWQRMGIPVGAIQAWLGHSDGSSITQDHYSNWDLSGGLMSKASV